MTLFYKLMTLLNNHILNISSLSRTVKFPNSNALAKCSLNYNMLLKWGYVTFKRGNNTMFYITNEKLDS